MEAFGVEHGSGFCLDVVVQKFVDSHNYRRVSPS